MNCIVVLAISFFIDFFFIIVSYDGIPLGAEYGAEIRHSAAREVQHGVRLYSTGGRERELQFKLPVVPIVKIELFKQNDFHEMVVDIFSYTTWLATYDVKICPPNLMEIAEEEEGAVGGADRGEAVGGVGAAAAGGAGGAAAGGADIGEAGVGGAASGGAGGGADIGAVGGALGGRRRQVCRSPVSESGILYPLPRYCPLPENVKETCQAAWKLEIEPQIEISYCCIYQEILTIRNWAIASQLEMQIAGVTSIKSASRGITPGRLGLGLHPSKNFFLNSITNQLILFWHSMPMFGLVINDEDNGVFILGGRYSKYSTKTTRFLKTFVSHQHVGVSKERDETGKLKQELLYGWMIKSPAIMIQFDNFYSNLTGSDVVFKSTLPGIYLVKRDYIFFRKHVNHTSRDCNYWENAKPRLSIELIYPIGYISTLLKENILTVNLFEKKTNGNNQVECVSVVPKRPTYLENLEGKTVIGLPIFKQYYVEFYFNERFAEFDHKRMKFAKIK